jgi:hypothetical protein
MSFIDSRWEVWDNKSLTVALHSYAADGFFDLEENGTTDESISDKFWCNIMVGTAFATLTSGCFFAVLNSDSATFASGVKCLAALGCEDYPLLVTEMTAGVRFSLAFPRYDLHKYLEVWFNPISEAASAGTVDCWFGLEPLSPVKTQKEPS